jgi:hypothetical protein
MGVVGYSVGVPPDTPTDDPWVTVFDLQLSQLLSVLPQEWFLLLVQQRVPGASSSL